MKTNRFLVTALLAATMLAGCSKTDNNTPDPSSTAVKFTTAITRASGTTWAADDEIGVFMKTAGGNISTSITLNAANVLYTTNGTTFATTTPIYYPQSGNVDFVAYYPHRATTATPYVYNVDVATQTTPADIDLLWSNNATNVPKGTTDVALQFSHKLSRVQINIKAGDGLTATDLDGMSMTIDGMATKADFDLATGVNFTNLSATAPIAPIGVTPAPTGFDKSFSAIVIPQTASGSTMTFTVGSDVYTYTIPATTFLTGKSYPYTITISKTEISVSVGNITDWVSAGDPEIGTAISYQVGDYFPDPKVDLTNATEKAKILGIVFRAKTATQTGLVVALDEANMVWGPIATETGATDMNNGSANMAKIQTLTDWKTKYPAFKYCADKGAGWYLPALRELEALRTVWNGGGGPTEVGGMRTTFNGWLTAGGGTAMTTNWYWSSSEYDTSSAWFVVFDNGYTSDRDKDNANYTVRAVLAF